MDKESKNCQFCTLEATTIYRTFVASVVPDPTNPAGQLSYDYVGDAVYTCNEHTLSVQGFLLNGAEEEE